MQRIILASDHGGFKLKESIKKHLKNKNKSVDDIGCFSEDSCDYPDFGFKLANEISSGTYDKGILICTSGIGMSIVANRVANVRAALCYNHEAAALSRAHNNANILVMGSRFVDENEAEKIIDAFFSTEFEGGRHQKRVEKIK